MDKNLKRKIEKVAKNNGDVSLAQLESTIDLVDKLDELKQAIESIPETVIPQTIIPEQKEVVFPDVQKVEIINHKEEKDDTEIKNLLKDLVAEVKKKEEYAYDIEIDSTLKEQLKGEQGEKGKDGIDGKNGTEITGEEIAGKLESLEGEDKLDISAIKGAEELVTDIVKEKISKIPKPKKQTFGVWRGGTEGYTIIESSDATINATATTGTVIYLLDATSGNITVNIPSAVGNSASIIIKKIDSSSNTITLDATGSETIDGAGTYVINGQYYSQNLISSGGNWYII